MNATIINIGNELLLGKTVNTNVAYLGAELANLGVPVEYTITIKDDPIAIKTALQNAWGRSDIVITTGGLGPTEDDLSKAAIAEFFGKQMYFNDDVWQYVQSIFAMRNMQTPPINRNQALVPDAFTVLRNEKGTAPGLHYREGNKLFFALQGVPVEMMYIFEFYMKQIIAECYPDAKPVIQKTIHTHGLSESRLAELFKLEELPEGVSLAWLPQTGRVDLRFYGYDIAPIEQAILLAECKIAPYIWGLDNETPAGTLLKLLDEQNDTLSLAESCTGGWVQKMITDVSGASHSFLGGMVAYSNDMKINVLGISDNILNSYGAVSSECATEMAIRIKELTKSSHAISVTGIAGPDGGTAEKSIGTVYFGFAAKERSWSIKQIFSGDRNSIRHKASEFAILELIKSLQGRK
ncbi:MAG: CinA family nicotinamide mononucleotide deamidase-related protein [Candidatus Cloacimonetes bacterium]|nr:CinA family nicotinamide mononucleotide deamidase-related protein [Candidatus Cloacimonadota bacterium]